MLLQQTFDLLLQRVDLQPLLLLDFLKILLQLLQLLPQLLDLVCVLGGQWKSAYEPKQSKEFSYLHNYPNHDAAGMRHRSRMESGPAA